MMDQEHSRTRLETESLVIGYAMSRLDGNYLAARKADGWWEAFREAAQALQASAASFKNLRDEFDPVHPNARLGWHGRSLRPSRLRVIEELQAVSDDALIEMVACILNRDADTIDETLDLLAAASPVVGSANVAERLLTGRRAEEFFLEHSLSLVQIKTDDILDFRQEACGFDFGVRGNPELAFEVKGLKPLHGGILFTDREWQEAKRRRRYYFLVVVGNLAAEPLARVFPDPYTLLPASCTLQTTVTASWRSTVSVSA